jgi:hypothetical protein
LKRTQFFLTLTLVYALIAWGCEHAGPVEAPPIGDGGEVTLSQIQASIFSVRCAVSGCHVAPASSAPYGLVLSEGQAYGTLVGVFSGEVPGVQRVKAGDPDSSYVVWKVEGDPRIQGGQMPARGALLTADERSALRNWIDNGAKDN